MGKIDIEYHIEQNKPIDSRWTKAKTGDIAVFLFLAAVIASILFAVFYEK